MLSVAVHVFLMITFGEGTRSVDEPGDNIAGAERNRQSEVDADASRPEASGKVPNVNPYSSLDFIDSVQPFYVNFSDAAATPKAGDDMSAGEDEHPLHFPTPKIKFRGDADGKSRLLLSWVTVTPDGRGRTYKLKPTNATASALTAGGNLSSHPFLGADGPRRRLHDRINGPDDRVRVSLEQVRTFPFRTIGQLEYKSQGTNWICSAALYGPKHVLTGATCLYDRESKKWNSDFKFYAGRYDGNTYLGDSSWAQASVPGSFVDGGFAEDDMGVIVLSEELGRELGWLGLTTGHRVYQPLLTTGYPGEKPFGSMWHQICNIIPSKYDVPRVFWHSCDTTGGQLGSPMYTQSYYIMGTDVGSMGTTNVACDITSDRFDWLVSFL